MRMRGSQLTYVPLFQPSANRNICTVLYCFSLCSDVTTYLVCLRNTLYIYKLMTKLSTSKNNNYNEHYLYDKL